MVGADAMLPHTRATRAEAMRVEGIIRAGSEQLGKARAYALFQRAESREREKKGNGDDYQGENLNYESYGSFYFR